jgi:predicted ATPase with chaperone activity
MRTRQLIVHSGAAPFNDYYYMLTEQGQRHAKAHQRANAYVGPAPVPLRDYVVSVEAQCISTESPTHEDLATACKDISIDEHLFDLIGPAVNSGAGMFLYGAPGNGKSTIAKRITHCFGQEFWIPRVLVDDGQLIKLFDASCHHEVSTNREGVLKKREYDRRWVRILRPTVTVGGELTMDNLDIRHDPTSNVSEAPLQLKSNGGCLVIDDFGRQRIEPAELLNRWIVPLETGQDFLTLATGKKIQVPFEQLIIFSTNLEPRDLVDEAFLRRIPYKIEINDPGEDEFRHLFTLYAEQLGCEYKPEVVDHLLDRHYRPAKRELRRCHPRDLLRQIRSYCRYRRVPFQMSCENVDRVAKSYLTNVLGKR